LLPAGSNLSVKKNDGFASSVSFLIGNVALQLRRQLADERGVPAYIIFSDVSLREMARKYPTNSAEFRRIPGVGAQKLKDFSEAFLSEINSHLVANPRRTVPKTATFQA
jgi:superfamily II DNA helicase RecQ